MTRIFFKSLLLIAFSLTGFSGARAQDTFKGIIPFVTSRTQVLELLGKPKSNNRYELDEGRVTIRYVTATATTATSSCVSLAPVDTVRAIEFQPYTDIKIEYLYLDPKFWRRVPVTAGHVPGFEVYINDTKGITYTVDTKGGVVTRILYEESEETCEMLRRRAWPGLAPASVFFYQLTQSCIAN